MMQLFLRWIIGGQTGKRESAWFAFLIWVGWSGWMVYVEFAQDRSLDMAQSMWMVVTPFVFTWLGTSHGFEWVSRQTRWGSAQLDMRSAVGLAGSGAIPDGVLDSLPDTRMPPDPQHRFAFMEETQGPPGTPFGVYDPNTSGPRAG